MSVHPAVSTAIHVSNIPVASDMICHFYIAELVTQMVEVWKQFNLHLAACKHLLATNMFGFANLFMTSRKDQG